MEPISVGIISLVFLFVLLLLAVPIGIAMGLAGLAGMVAIIGVGPALSLFGTTVYENTVTYSLSIIPLMVGSLQACRQSQIHWLVRRRNLEVSEQKREISGAELAVDEVSRMLHTCSMHIWRLEQVFLP